MTDYRFINIELAICSPVSRSFSNVEKAFRTLIMVNELCTLLRIKK